MIAALDSNDDWIFGRESRYLFNQKEIELNVKTRLKSCKNDWFLDSTAHIDWLNILGEKNNQQFIISEIERVTLSTAGVTRVNKVEIIEIKERFATFSVDYETVYSNSSLEFTI